MIFVYQIPETSWIPISFYHIIVIHFIFQVWSLDSDTPYTGHKWTSSFHWNDFTYVLYFINLCASGLKRFQYKKYFK